MPVPVKFEAPVRAILAVVAVVAGQQGEVVLDLESVTAGARTVPGKRGQSHAEYWR